LASSSDVAEIQIFRMDSINPQTDSGNVAADSTRAPLVKIFGVGSAGICVLEQLLPDRLASTRYIAVSADAQSLGLSNASEKLLLESRPLRGLGTGGDPAQGQKLGEEHAARLQEACGGASAIFIIAGLGGGAGTGISPVLARVAKETGALVMGFVSLPFECEGSRRQALAADGLEELRSVADGVIFLRSQKALKLIDENTSVLDTFKLTNQLLADGVRGVWRLLMHKGLIELHFEELCGLLRDQHAESSFAVAEATGVTRSRELLEKLFAHPMLDGGALEAAEAVLVSLVGGPDLAMNEVNRVMEEITAKCPSAQVTLGAAIDDGLRGRLAVTLVAGRKIVASDLAPTRIPGTLESLDTQLLSRGLGVRPGSPFVGPAPNLSEEQLRAALARQADRKKKSPKMRQGQLPLDIISKGRFDKSEPTIHKGEDLDVPTYIRRGVSLN
jgi:cell division protein FtsZ